MFAPANRADLVLKFPRISADCSVIDLEDGTPVADKSSARRGLAELFLRTRESGFVGRLGVRVNAPNSEFFADDIKAAIECRADVILVPKVEKPDDLEPVTRAIQSAGVDIDVFAGIETAAGVLNAAQICRCAPELRAVIFGAEDLATDIGARRTVEGSEVLVARSMVLLAAKATRILAIDQAVVDIRDEALFKRDSEAGRNLGYDGKICLTPRQTELANLAFSPTNEEISYAERLIAHCRNAYTQGIGTIDFEGKMIDAPLIKRARDILYLRQFAHHDQAR
nr:CoA ester lyase [Allopusillimonas ginsengisoli]